MFAALLLRLGLSRILALLLIMALYSLVITASGASSPAESADHVGRVVSNLNGAAHSLDSCNPGWSVIPSPNVASYNNQLNGVAALSAGDAWAVGRDNELGAPDSTLVEHWAGSTWSVVQSPDDGTDGSRLDGVAALSADDVWAVGQYSNGTVPRTLVEHWDGSVWSIVPSPNLGSSSNVLNGVAAMSADDVWAVGYGGGGSGVVFQTLVEHWDGSAWAIVSSPNSDPLANELAGVSAISTGDVWAVGNFYDTSIGAHRTLVEHWDGSTWSIVPSPNNGNDDEFLNGVAALSGADVWAVGFHNLMDRATLVEHWDGSVWSIVPSPNIAGAPNTLSGVAGIAPGDVWAAGYDTPNNLDRTLTEHWDGNSWSIVDSPDVGTSYNYLYGVAAVPSGGSGPGDAWAVGQYDDPGNGRRTLVEQFDSCSASPTPAASMTSTSTPLQTSTSTPTPALTSSSTPVFTGTPVPTLTGTSVPVVTSTSVPTLTSTTVATSTRIAPATATGAPAATATRTSTPLSTETPCSLTFSDVQPGEYFYNAVIYLACHGAVSGYPDGTFHPYRNTTRGQVAKIVVLAFGIPIDTSGGPHFSDVPTASTFYRYVETAYHNSLASGYPDHTFRPANNVTRGQLSKIVVTAAVQVNGWELINPSNPTFSDVPFGSTFYRYIETAASKGVISGYTDHTFRPGNVATRGQIAKIVFLAVTQH